MEEKKLVVCRKHWIAFIGQAVIGTAFLFTGFFGMLYGTKNSGTAFFIFIVGVIIFARAYFSYKTTYIMLTEKSIVVRQGILFPSVRVISRIRVKGIHRRYTVPGLIFGYRTIIINCWGENEPAVSFKRMTRVNEFASALGGLTDEEEKLLR